MFHLPYSSDPVIISFLSCRESCRSVSKTSLLLDYMPIIQENMSDGFHVKVIPPKLIPSDTSL